MSLEKMKFEIELYELARQQLGMPRSIALGYARGWSSSNHEGFTPQEAINRDIELIGNPTEQKKLQRREA